MGVRLTRRLGKAPIAHCHRAAILSLPDHKCLTFSLYAPHSYPPRVFALFCLAAAKWGCPFYEASAKERINNEACFFDVVREIRKQDNKPAKGKEGKKDFCNLL